VDDDRDLLDIVRRSVAGTGAKAMASGKWLVETMIDTAPRIPIRNKALLESHHPGLEPPELAAELIRAASRSSATIGAASGALMGAEELAPPAWVTIPFELVIETLSVAAIEMKLVAELHEVYGRPVTGSAGDRALALVRAWAERRGVTPAVLAASGGLAETLGRSTRNEVIRLARRRMLRRLGRNLTSLAPLLAGAVAGAEVNRRGTKSLGEAVVRDLASV
jgi:uncharacterized protein (DUF697 family)